MTHNTGLISRLKTAWQQSAKPFDLKDYIAIIKQAQSALECHAQEIGGYHTYIQILPTQNANEPFQFGIEIRNPAYRPGHPRLSPPQMTTMFTISAFFPDNHKCRVAAASANGLFADTVETFDLVDWTQREIKRASRVTRTGEWNFMDQMHTVDAIFETAKARAYNPSRLIRAKQIYDKQAEAQGVAAPSC